MALGGGVGVELGGLGGAPGDALAVGVDEAEAELRLRVALRRGLPPEPPRPHQVPRHALPVVVQQPQLVLRVRMALVRRPLPSAPAPRAAMRRDATTRKRCGRSDGVQRRGAGHAWRGGTRRVSR